MKTLEELKRELADIQTLIDEFDDTNYKIGEAVLRTNNILHIIAEIDYENKTYKWHHTNLWFRLDNIVRRAKLEDLQEEVRRMFGEYEEYKEYKYYKSIYRDETLAGAIDRNNYNSLLDFIITAVPVELEYQTQSTIDKPLTSQIPASVEEEKDSGWVEVEELGTSWDYKNFESESEELVDKINNLIRNVKDNHTRIDKLFEMVKGFKGER